MIDCYLAANFSCSFEFKQQRKKTVKNDVKSFVLFLYSFLEPIRMYIYSLIFEDFFNGKQMTVIKKYISAASFDLFLRELCSS